MGALITALLTVGVLVLLVGRSVRVVPAGRTGVVVRMGRFHSVRSPGVTFVVPMLDQVRLVDMTVQPLTVEVEAPTKDGVAVAVRAGASIIVTDPRLALFAVSNYRLAAGQLVRTAVREVLGETTVDERLRQREALGERVRAEVASSVERWGVRLEQVEIHDVQPATWAAAPRGRAERRRHALALLQSEDTLWFATTSAGDEPHLAPFAFVWDGRHVVVATREESLTARNVGRTGRARVAVGSFSDVVLIDGDVTACPPDEIGQDVRDRLANGPAGSGPRPAGAVYLRLAPRRVQAWWSMSETADPTIMRDGRWID